MARKKIPPFLYPAEVALDARNEDRLHKHMKNWGTVYKHLVSTKKKTLDMQVKELELMLVHELLYGQRMQILIRIMGRYKMAVSASLDNQMFGGSP